MQFTVSGVPSGQAAGLVAWLQIATVPKHATATPASLMAGIHGLTDRPARRWPIAPPSSTRAYAPVMIAAMSQPTFAEK